MKFSFALLTAIGVAGLTQFASAGDITGTVTLNGTPPPEKEMTPVENDPTCGKLHDGKVFTQFYVVGANKGLGDVIVMLKGDTVKPQAADASTPPAVLDQKGCLYVPQILAIQTGQKLLVKTSDPMMHNVHINPAISANKDAFESAGKISQVQMPGGADLTFTFSAPENFMKFNCDVHNWMFAWVTVVDNPYFAVTDKDGKYTIKNVPAGKYKIVALHRKAAPTGVEKDVDVTAGGGTTDFTIDIK
jgi:hypothetical protein